MGQKFGGQGDMMQPTDEGPGPPKRPLEVEFEGLDIGYEGLEPSAQRVQTSPTPEFPKIIVTIKPGPQKNPVINEKNIAMAVNLLPQAIKTLKDEDTKMEESLDYVFDYAGFVLGIWKQIDPTCFVIIPKSTDIYACFSGIYDYLDWDISKDLLKYILLMKDLRIRSKIWNNILSGIRERFGPAVHDSVAKLFGHFSQDSKISPDKVSNDIMVILSSNVKIFEDMAISLPDARKAFSASFYGHDNVLEPFKRFVLDDIIGKFNSKPTDFHSLYFSLIQSSGWGKSRLLIESGKSFFNLVYGNVRNVPSGVKDTGFPVNQRALLDHLQKIGSEIPKLQEFISNIFMATCEYAVKGNARILEWCPESATWKKVSGSDCPAHSIISAKFKNLDPIDVDIFWTPLLVSDASKQIKFLEVQNAYGTHFGISQRFPPPGELIRVKTGGTDENPEYITFLSELLVVFDEARSLLGHQFETPEQDTVINIFRNIRKALQNLGSRNCVLVFVDTVSRVSNFLPADYLDPSHRFGGTFHSLLPAFYEIQTYDCHILGALLNSSEFWFGSDTHLRSLDTCSLEMDLRKRFIRGRPLWNSFLEGGKTKQTVSGVVTFAMQKLSGKRDPVIASDSDTDGSGSISTMSIRFGIEGIFDKVLCEQIVARHMGTLMYLGGSSSRQAVAFPAEPVLSEAACQLLHRKSAPDPLRLQKFLNLFSGKCLNGMIDAGALGELVARVVVALTYDQLVFSLQGDRHDREGSETPFSTSLFFSNPIKLSDLLNSLYPPTFQELFKKHIGHAPFTIPKELDDATCCITSFSMIKCLPRRKEEFEVLLKNSYHLGAGLMAPNCQAGTDLILPLRLSDGVTPGMVLIQVRDIVEYSLKEALEATGHKLTPTFCFAGNFDDTTGISYMSIMMDLCHDGFFDVKTMKVKNKGAKEVLNMKEEHIAGLRQLCQDYPNHIYLPGLDVCSVLTGANAPIGAALKNIRGARVDRIDMMKRKNTLIGMDSHKYMFIPGCKCGLSAAKTKFKKDHGEGVKFPKFLPIDHGLSCKEDFCTCYNRLQGRFLCAQGCSCMDGRAKPEAEPMEVDPIPPTD